MIFFIVSSTRSIRGRVYGGKISRVATASRESVPNSSRPAWSRDRDSLDRREACPIVSIDAMFDLKPRILSSLLRLMIVEYTHVAIRPIPG